MSEAPKFALASVMPVRANEGAPMPIRHPVTYAVMHNADGSEAAIILRGQTSKAFRQAVTDINRLRVQQELTQEQIQDPAHVYETDTMLLVACTVGWCFDELTPGEPFLYSPENAKQLWEDERFDFLRNQATSFMLSHANFLPLPLPSSSAGPGTSSESTSPSPDLQEAA